MNILCLYYSRTGAARAIMERLKQELEGAAAEVGTPVAVELVEYRETKDRSGARGYLSACVDTILHRTPALQPLETPRPLGEYDAVLFQVPIWAEAPAIVGTALLDQVGGSLPTDTWFVVTHQAKASYEKKIPRLDRFLKTPSRGFLSVCTESPDQAAMKAFAEQIQSFSKIV